MKLHPQPDVMGARTMITLLTALMLHAGRTSGDSLNSYVSTPALPANWMIEGTYQW